MLHELRIYRCAPGRLAATEWIAARAESEKDGPILAHTTNYMLQPTSYSKLK